MDDLDVYFKKFSRLSLPACKHEKIGIPFMSFSSLKLQQQINCSCNVFIHINNVEINFVLYHFFILFDNNIMSFN